MAYLDDAHQQRIVELQAEVIGMRRVLPKTYRKLMKIEYSHFHSNLKRGVCTVPPEMLNVHLANSSALDQHLHAIAEVQPSMQPKAAAAIEEEVRQRARSLRNTRQALNRMQRRKPTAAVAAAVLPSAAAVTTASTTATTMTTVTDTRTIATRRESECSDAEL